MKFEGIPFFCASWYTRYSYWSLISFITASSSSSFSGTMLTINSYSLSLSLARIISSLSIYSYSRSGFLSFFCISSIFVWRSIFSSIFFSIIFFFRSIFCCLIYSSIGSLSKSKSSYFGVSITKCKVSPYEVMSIASLRFSIWSRSKSRISKCPSVTPNLTSNMKSLLSKLMKEDIELLSKQKWVSYLLCAK